MPQSIALIWTHIIFSTKARYPFLQDKTIRQEMHVYVAGTCRQLSCPTRIVNGTADHVHILCELSKNISLSSLLRDIKHSSSIRIKSHGGMLAKFQWQRGYAAFGVSASRLEAVHDYIVNQEEHHKKLSFQDELRRILRQHNFDVDERYLWD